MSKQRSSKRLMLLAFSLRSSQSSEQEGAGVGLASVTALMTSKTVTTAINEGINHSKRKSLIFYLATKLRKEIMISIAKNLSSFIAQFYPIAASSQ
jgi:hypothetical protein